MYPKQSNENIPKNAGYPPQQPSGPFMHGQGPPPPSYTKEAEASAPQVFAQYPVAHPQQSFYPGLQPQPGGAYYASTPAHQQTMYYPNGLHPMQQMQQQHMTPGIFATQSHYPAGPPPGYGGGPQYPTGYCPPPPYQSPMQVQHQQTVYQQSVGVPTATFDAGARFGGKGGGSLSIPPPPPGYAPTAAQAAAMNGQPVVAQQKSGGFFTGGKGAGATFW